MRYKLVCFDLDGTLIEGMSSIWVEIENALGVAHKTKPAKDAFFNKTLSYDDWLKHDVEIWKEHGLRKKQVLDLLKPFSVMPGALETLETLKKEGYKIAVISDSINLVLEACLPNYADFFDDVFINKISFDETGHISGYTPTKFGFEKKADGIKHICTREGISLAESVFIGDHDNDVEAARSAGLSIAFNPKSEKLKEVADHCIAEKDLRLILRLISG